jgi:hypothetical protein
VNELNGFQFDILLRQIDAVELEARRMRITVPDHFEIERVEVQPNDAGSDAAVNVVESVSASDSQDGD